MAADLDRALYSLPSGTHVVSMEVQGTACHIAETLVLGVKAFGQVFDTGIDLPVDLEPFAAIPGELAGATGALMHY